MKILDNVSMKNYTTYKTGGLVKTMYFPSNEEELIDLIKKLKNEKEKYFIIGNGSNLIIDDKDFNGSIINLKEMKKYEIKEDEVYCACGVMIPFLANKVINESYKGLEWAISIPGTIGGCIYNNAGAYNSSIQDILKSVRVLDSNENIIELSNEDCKFTYRNSIFKETKNYIILSCILKIEKYDKQKILELVEDRRQRRIASQPLEYPSAGSVFRNPPDCSAGKLIDDLNLKKTTIGGAQISEKHANFIINLGDATSKDIKSLIKLMYEKVKKEYTIELILEQEIINWE
jgi:UDP-N-acetylmuramate dehydrogenase